MESSFHSFPFFSFYSFTHINVCVLCLSMLHVNHSFYKAFFQWKIKENLVNFLPYDIERWTQGQPVVWSYFLWEHTVGEVENVIIFYLLSINKMFVILFTIYKTRVRKNEKVTWIMVENLNFYHKILNIRCISVSDIHSTLTLLNIT